MAELLLVSNPHRRRKGRKSSRRRARRSNPHHYRRRRRNPHRAHRRRRNPSYRRRRHSNPSLRGITSQFMPTVKQSFVGAGGALINDFLYGFLSPYMTSFLGTLGGAAPFLQYGFKLVTALGAGYVGGMLKLNSRALAEGAATVATHDFLKAQLQSLAPTIFGSGGTLALSGYSGLGAYLSGSAPVVGTATFPATYLPQHQPVQMGAYLSGSSGMADGESGMYNADSMGCDYWGN